LGDAANICPSVLITAFPVAAAVGESIGIQAYPSDLDAVDAGMSPRLTFAWMTTGGKLSDQTTPRVTLDCTAPGRIVVSLEVSDGRCTTKETVELHCTATDAGSSSSGGSGGSDGGTSSGGTSGGSGGSSSSEAAPGTGSGGSVGSGGVSSSGGTVGSGGSSSGSGGTSGASGGATDSGGLTPGSGGSHGSGGGTGSGKLPTEDVSDACLACTDFNCVPDTDGCQIYGDGSPDRKLCEDVYGCIRDTGCLGGTSDPIHCWCGTNYDANKTDHQTCLTDNTPPTQANGPCLKQVLAAAKSTDAPTIRLRWSDPAYPVGGAVNLTVCRVGFCDMNADNAPDWKPSCGIVVGK
jgi:hypothetical protein